MITGPFVVDGIDPAFPYGINAAMRPILDSDPVRYRAAMEDDSGAAVFLSIRQYQFEITAFQAARSTFNATRSAGLAMFAARLRKGK